MEWVCVTVSEEFCPLRLDDSRPGAGAALTCFYYCRRESPLKGHATEYEPAFFCFQADTISGFTVI